MRSKKAKQLKRNAAKFLKDINHVDEPGYKTNPKTGEIRATIERQLYQNLKSNKE